MSPAEPLPQVYHDLLKLAAAGMRHEAAGHSRTDCPLRRRIKLSPTRFGRTHLRKFVSKRWALRLQGTYPFTG
jgi:hypothetical protein